MTRSTDEPASNDAPNVFVQRSIFRAGEPNAFGIYHDLVQSSGADTALYGGDFTATITARRFRDLMLFDRQIEGADHRREPEQIRRDGFEHYYLHVLRSGRMACGPPGEERWLSPGDAILLDATLPQRAVAQGADYVSVILARDIAEAVVPKARRLHARVLPRSTNGGVGDAVLSLARLAPSLSFGDAAGGDRLIAGLLGAVTGQVQAAVEDDEIAAVDVTRRLLASHFIDAHLGRQELDVNAIARGIGVSRSTLYRVFRSTGGVEREITQRRVARLKVLLLDPDETRSLDGLAHFLGFATPSHCSRVFKDAYGLSPNRLRAELRSSIKEGARALEVAALSNWYEELNQRC